MTEQETRLNEDTSTLLDDAAAARAWYYTRPSDPTRLDAMLKVVNRMQNTTDRLNHLIRDMRKEAELDAADPGPARV